MKPRYFLFFILLFPLAAQAARPDSSCYYLFLNYQNEDMPYRPLDETRLLRVERSSASIQFNECQTNGSCETLLVLDEANGFGQLKNFAAHVAVQTDALNSNRRLAQSSYGVIGSLVGFFGLSAATIYGKRDVPQISRREALNSLFSIGVGTAVGGFLGMTTSLVLPPDEDALAAGVLAGAIAGQIPVLAFLDELEDELKISKTLSRKLSGDYWALLHYFKAEPAQAWAPQP